MTEVNVKDIKTFAQFLAAMQRATEILSAVGQSPPARFAGLGEPLPDDPVIEWSEEEAAEFRYLQKALVALANELKGLY